MIIVSFLLFLLIPFHSHVKGYEILSSSSSQPVSSEIFDNKMRDLKPNQNRNYRDYCQILGTPNIPKYAAVVSRWDEDVRWVRTMPIKTLVYEHEKPTALYNVKINKGSESSAYIQFIIDHYQCLPMWVLFLHAHGQTQSFGKAHAATRHHPTNPSTMAALIDVDLENRPFLGLGHFSETDWKMPSGLHPAARKFSSHSPPDLSKSSTTHPHHAAFVPTEEGKQGCTCSTLKTILPAQSCNKPWSWNVGAEFWVRRDRILATPFDWWRFARAVLCSSPSRARYGHKGGVASEAGYCFESIWHAILGEPFYNYQPAFRFIEELPRVTLEGGMRDEVEFNSVYPNLESSNEEAQKGVGIDMS